MPPIIFSYGNWISRCSMESNRVVGKIVPKLYSIVPICFSNSWSFFKSSSVNHMIWKNKVISINIEHMKFGNVSLIATRLSLYMKHVTVITIHSFWPTFVDVNTSTMIWSIFIGKLQGLHPSTNLDFHLLLDCT